MFRRRSFRRRKRVTWAQVNPDPRQWFEVPLTPNSNITPVLAGNAPIFGGTVPATAGKILQRDQDWIIDRLIGKVSVASFWQVASAAPSGWVIQYFYGFFISEVDETGTPLDSAQYLPSNQQFSDSHWLWKSQQLIIGPRATAIGDFTGVSGNLGNGGPLCGEFDLRPKRRVKPGYDLFFIMTSQVQTANVAACLMVTQGSGFWCNQANLDFRLLLHPATRR